MLSPPVPFNRHVLALRREVGVVKQFKRERAATWREKKNQFQEESNFWKRTNRNVGNNVLSENEKDKPKSMLNKPATQKYNLQMWKQD